MSWHILKNEQKIARTIRHLISANKEIQVHIKGKSKVFTSKIIKIDKGDASLEVMKTILIIEKLVPDKGNSLIQSMPEVGLYFLINDKPCRCSVYYLGISSTPPYFGFIVSCPKSIEIEEKRFEERFVYEFPDFVSAEFSLGKESKEKKTYELAVMDCSRHGLGLIITKEHFDLLQKIKKGHKLQDITFYASWSMIKVDGIVKHLTQIEDGKHKGCYLLGIESKEIIESCRPKEQ